MPFILGQAQLAAPPPTQHMFGAVALMPGAVALTLGGCPPPAHAWGCLHAAAAAACSGSDPAALSPPRAAAAAGQGAAGGRPADGPSTAWTRRTLRDRPVRGGMGTTLMRRGPGDSPGSGFRRQRTRIRGRRRRRIRIRRPRERRSSGRRAAPAPAPAPAAARGWGSRTWW